jgi:apolipoprotein N-acyltransferase
MADVGVPATAGVGLMVAERAWGRWALTVGSGLLTVLAFPNWNWGVLGFVSLVPFLVVLRRASPRQGFALGLAWGLAFFLCALYWVTYVMTTYGHMLLPFALLGWVSLAVILAGYPALFGWAVAHLAKLGPLPWTLAVSALWVAVEFLRTYLWTGFPWVLLGYSQAPFLEAIQIAKNTGVYGVSFLVIVVNAALAAATFEAPRRRRAAPGALAAGLLAGAVGYGWAVLRTPPPPADVPVAIVQGNIEQGIKWEPHEREATLEKYRRLTLKVVREKPALVVWPEAAMPFPIRTYPVLGPRALAVAREAGVPILLGGPDQLGRRRFDNSMFLVGETGEILGKYAKRHLVPFGEYVPWQSVFFFMEKLAVGIGDFVPGQEVTIFSGPFGRFSVSICYEVIFPDEVRQGVLRGAEFLVNVTNDAWFGRTSAPYQHLIMSAFRAVENDVYMVRAANTGISAFIEPSGRITHATALYTDAAFVGRIGRRPGGTFYTRKGDVFAWACSAAAIAVVLAGLWGRRRAMPA